MVSTLMSLKAHLLPWNEPYFSYKIQWLKLHSNVRWVLISNFVTMQHCFLLMVALDIQAIGVTHADESMHLGMIFNWTWEMAWGIQ